MKKIVAISLCAACLSIASLAAQKSSSNSKASFAKFVEEANKAQTDNDAKWMEANLSDAYVEGTSFGEWIPKAQLIKDANDPANNKFTKSDISDVQTDVVGNVGGWPTLRAFRRVGFRYAGSSDSYVAGRCLSSAFGH